jgi:hypothetical protein
LNPKALLMAVAMTFALATEAAPRASAIFCAHTGSSSVGMQMPDAGYGFMAPLGIVTVLVTGAPLT